MSKYADIESELCRKIPRELIKVSPMYLKLYVLLVEKAKDKNSSSFDISNKQILSWYKVTDATIRKAFNRLQELGYVTFIITKHTGNGKVTCKRKVILEIRPTEIIVPEEGLIQICQSLKENVTNTVS